MMRNVTGTLPVITLLAIAMLVVPAAASTFGGPVPTPNYEALAQQGLRYNRFHTTAMCSPTRAAPLTGRNHHHVAMGSIVNLAEAPTAVHLAATVPYGFQVSDAVGVGRDVVTALTGDYQLPFRYPGDIGRLRIHLGGATSR